MDNYSTHKTALIRNWFAKRPRFDVHFTPRTALAQPRGTPVRRTHDEPIRRGTFRSVPELKAAIQEFIEAHQANRKPFVWTKSADEILAGIADSLSGPSTHRPRHMFHEPPLQDTSLRGRRMNLALPENMSGGRVGASGALNIATARRIERRLGARPILGHCNKAAAAPPSLHPQWDERTGCRVWRQLECPVPDNWSGRFECGERDRLRHYSNAGRSHAWT